MFIAKRGFAKLTESAKAAHANAAVHAKKDAYPSSVARVPLPQRGSGKQTLKVSRLPNDLLVVSEDSVLPAVRITLAVKAGARHEPADLPGLSHALRNAASLATKYCSAFGLSRNLEQLGANLRASTTRDHTIYSLECARDNVHEAIKYLAYVTTQQEYRSWEVHDAAERMGIDLQVYKTQPHVRLIEGLHKAAYRGSMTNSLFAPEFASHHYNEVMLTEFVKNTFKTNRMALSGLGISHDELVSYGINYFTPNPGNHDMGHYFKNEDAEAEHHTSALLAGSVQDEPAKYGGGESLEDTIDYLAYAAVVSEGAGLNKPKDVLTLALLQQLIGVESHIKWSNGANASALSAAAAGVAKEPCAVSAINLTHADTGLFGFSVVANGKDVGPVLRACVGVFRGGKGVDQQRFEDAKTRLKASLLMSRENRSDLVQDMAVQALATGSVLSPEDALNIVDKISMDELVAAAKKATTGKLTFAAVGNLAHCPRIDQLM